MYFTSEAHIRECYRIARWWFTTSPRRKSEAMFAASMCGGGITDLVHEVFINLIRNPPPDDITLSSAVCNQCRWTSRRLIARAFEKRRREQQIPVTREAYTSDFYETPIREEAAVAVSEVLRSLTYRHREVIKLRFGIGDGNAYTLHDTGRALNVTRERVRQIETNAILRLQNPPRSNKLKPHAPDR